MLRPGIARAEFQQGSFIFISIRFHFGEPSDPFNVFVRERLGRGLFGFANPRDFELHG